MGSDIGTVEIVHWVSYIFPDLAEYLKIIIPTVVIVASVLGVLSNILPDPDFVYPVPDVDDIDIEMIDSGRVIYTVTRISRCVTLFANRIIRSKMYRVIFKVVQFFGRIVARLRGQSASSTMTKITEPKPYKIDMNRRKR